MLKGRHSLMRVGVLSRGFLDAPNRGGASPIIVSFRSAHFRRPRISATSQPQSIRDHA